MAKGTMCCNHCVKTNTIGICTISAITPSSYNRIRNNAEEWSVERVVSWIGGLPNITLNNNNVIEMSKISHLFEYHCITGRDLVDLSFQDIMELLSTREVMNANEEISPRVLQTIEYVNKYLLTTDNNVITVAASVFTAIYNLFNNYN
ncbi:hypothetical protein ABK040_006300 [Willaertia magna]